MITVEKLSESDLKEMRKCRRFPTLWKLLTDWKHWYLEGKEPDSSMLTR